MIDVDVINQAGTIVASVIACLGGPAAIVASMRGLRTFRSDMRSGLADLASGMRRISAEIRAEADNDPRPVFSVLPSGDVEWANPAFAERFGWSREDMIGAGWLNAVHPLDRAKVAEEWHHAKVAKRYFVIDARTQHRDGVLRNDVVTIRLLVKKCHDGEFYGWRGTFLDKQQEAIAA